MKKLLTLMLAAMLFFAASESSFAQKKKKKGKKGKVTAHGEKDNDAKFNERKSKGAADGPAGSSKNSKKKKGKKSKSTGFAPVQSEFDLFYSFLKKEDERLA